MFKIVAIAIVVLLAAVLVCASTQPSTFRVQREVSIKARPEKIAGLISDFHSWSLWSPYEKLDPAMKKTFNGAESGRGAVYEWEGNSKAGTGRMEITDASASRVAIKLDFQKPFKSHSVAEFTLDPQGDSTHVTWAMHGPNLYIGKVMGLFVNMDTLIGQEFEAGLANLKALAEK
jgi:hypothetical protein